MTGSGDRSRFLKRLADQQQAGRLPEAAVGHPGAFSWKAAPADTDALLQQFTRELSALGGVVHEASTAAEVVSIVQDACAAAGVASSLLAWTADQLPIRGVLDALREAGLSVDTDPVRQNGAGVPAGGRDREARLFEMSRAGIGLTAASAAIADCGAIVVTSGAGRSRMASLLPPVHIALVRRDSVYPTAAAFLAANAALVASTANLVFITGPSRTADIELTLTRGVHGPKEIHVVFCPQVP
jgi:L-lactate dehydrogenase complex protein LldG